MIGDCLCENKSCCSQEGKRFLFIGNSHTFTNNLPGALYELARAGGHQIEIKDLTSSYERIANELGALLIPGGNLYHAALEHNMGFELWGEDGQHPSTEGTYLAACGAYALFFEESPVGNAYIGELDLVLHTHLYFS